MNTLSLLSLKCAYNTFDLSSGMVHISIRDQIVRASLLIRDLVGSGQPCREILIVGAGVAGVCAATEAARLGVKVVCVDTNERPFKLQHATKNRHVGPYMYEWPAVVSQQQHFPPVDWPRREGVGRYFETSVRWHASSPMRANVLGQKLEDWLTAQLPDLSPPPKFLMNVSKASVKPQVKAFIAAQAPMALAFSGTDWPGNAAANVTVQPDFIILAAGMGVENCQLIEKVKGIEGIKFWKDDKLLKAANKDVGIFGGGDGAMQDFLRALSVHEHGLDFVNALTRDAEVRRLFESEYEYLLSIEQQNRLACTWTTEKQTQDEIFSSFDKACHAVARKLSEHHGVRRAVAGQLKSGTGSVQLFCRDTFFRKSYLLNRFLVHLIDCCQFCRTDEFDHALRFSVNFAYTAVAAKKKAGGGFSIDLETPKGKANVQIDVLVVRYGVNRDTTALKQMLGLKNKGLATRTTLAQIPMPFV